MIGAPTANGAAPETGRSATERLSIGRHGPLDIYPPSPRWLAPWGQRPLPRRILLAEIASRQYTGAARSLTGDSEQAGHSEGRRSLRSCEDARNLRASVLEGTRSASPESEADDLVRSRA